MTKRIQLSRRSGWKKPRGAVVVSRPSVFGNPFSVKFWGHSRAVQLYRWMLDGRWKKIRETVSAHTSNPLQLAMLMMELMLIRHRINKALPELFGKDLACWCNPGESCHADVLLARARKPAAPAKAHDNP